MIKNSNVIQSNDEKVVKVLAYVIMGLLALAAIAPFWMLVSASFTDNLTLARTGYGFFPQKFSLEAYRYLALAWRSIGHAYLITVIVTIAGTVASLLITSMFAYGLIQKTVPGIKLIMILLIISILFNGGIVSTYFIYSNVFNIKNTIFALIVPNLLMNGFTVILVMNYYRQSISQEILEATRIDGASEMGIYWRVVLPLSTPIMATVGLMVGIAYWNDWTNGLYFISDSNLYSVQLLLNEMNQNIQFLASAEGGVSGMLGVEIPGISVRMTIAVVGILPIIIAYPFFQRYFTAGLTLGSVKG